MDKTSIYAQGKKPKMETAMKTCLIYRRPLPGSAAKPILTEMTEAELVAFVGQGMALQLARGEVVTVGNYTAVDLVAFFESCSLAGDETRLADIAGTVRGAG
jgi:hypothetical protein